MGKIPLWRRSVTNSPSCPPLLKKEARKTTPRVVKQDNIGPLQTRPYNPIGVALAVCSPDKKDL